MALSLEDRKAHRFRLLNALYEALDGNSSEIAWVNIEQLAEQIGMPLNDACTAMTYLEGEGLAVYRVMGGGIGITHQGVLQVEEALSEPEAPTKYFPAVVNITQVHTMTHSQIQQATSGSNQAMTVSPHHVTELQDFLKEFREALPSLPLSPEHRSEAEADVATVSAQAGSPRPKRPVIAEGLRSLRTILEATAGNMAAGALLDKLLRLGIAH